MQEATETPAQTAKEARHGDRQAQRLEAKNAAAASNSSAQRASPVINSTGQVTGTKINTKA
jgi:hypothetical protein